MLRSEGLRTGDDRDGTVVLKVCGKMTLLYRLILFYTIFSMVAEVVMGTGDGGTSKSGSSGANANSNAMTLIKALASATKLTDTNYIAWFAGLVTVLMGFTGDPFDKLQEVIEKLQGYLTDSLEDIYKRIIQQMLLAEYQQAVAAAKSAGTSMTPEEFIARHEVSKDLYQTILLTISDSCEAMVAIKNHLATSCFKKGIEALKYIHDNVGPGSGSTQIGRTMDLLNEKQLPDEHPVAFGTRLNNMNSSLTDKVQDNVLKQIFFRGLSDSGCRAFCVRESASNPKMSYLQLTHKAKEFEVQERVCAASLARHRVPLPTQP